MDRLEALGQQLSQVTMYDIKSYYNQAKSMVLNLSEMEVKVREATNDEPWGASSTLMNEIAQGTFNFQQFNEIMPAIYSRFMEKEAKQWRQIYKALQLLEYLIKNGSERTVDDARSHVSTIKMLRNFHYIDEKGKDQGINVRNRSREIVELLADLDKVRSERRKAKANKSKYTGTGNDGLSFSSGDGGRYGGFGSDALYGSSGGGGSYDQDYGGSSSYGEGGGGSSGGFRDSSSRKGFQEYDAGDDEDLPPRTSGVGSRADAGPPRRQSTSKSTTTTSPPSKQKAPEVDLLGGLDDEPVAAAPEKALPSTNSLSVLDSNDDFGDFAAAPQATQPSKPNVFEFLSQTQATPIVPTSTVQQPVMSMGHNRQLSGGLGGMNFGAPTVTAASLMQPQRQTSYTSTTSMGMGMGGGGMLSPTSMGNGMQAQSTKPTTPAAQTSAKSAGGFDDLWSMSLGSSSAKPAGGVSTVGGGKSIQQLEKEKAQASIWGGGAASSKPPQGNDLFGSFGGSSTTTTSAGGGADDLLL